MALTLTKLLSISLDIATEMLSNQPAQASTRLFVVGLVSDILRRLRVAR